MKFNEVTYNGFALVRDPNGESGKKVTISLRGQYVARRASYTAAMRTVDKIRKSIAAREKREAQ